MKTITESITLMVLCIVVAFFCALAMIGNIIVHNWWLVAINVICISANVILARIAYKQAKYIEESIEKRILDIFVERSIDSVFMQCAIRKILKDIDSKDKEDEA